ncbi:D-arabinono-1,4-lactone oxidase [Phyllobacterium sp. YR531]|uniref:D-arabinono-1,4-lactone oxidase n=1 Tax=Phyllobacterium sp. YR531 TaxID=1144343 RepID=UPI00026F7DF9|nr:D-arabinono-1,4-lactone oxidase [Phyllobacterium sp. YR531]EJN06330.1 FAD-linked oxidoreductase [Phyllobacterium sp. YR531]
MAIGNSWQNWAGSVTATPQLKSTPQTIDQLSAAIRSSPGPIRIVGTGHSFTPLVKSDGTILSLDNFSGLISHDKETLQARVGTGTKIGALAKLLHGVGQALPNMGDIDKQAFGGGLGTATHGSGIRLGAYHTQLTAMQVVDGRGKVHEFSKETTPDLMNAMGASLGAFGAVTAVTIQNMENYRLHRRRWVEPIANVLDQFEKRMTAYRSSEFYYIPFSGQALFLSSDITRAVSTVRPPEEDDSALVTLKRLRSYLLHFPWLRRKLIGSALARFPVEDYVEDWLRVYTSERNVKFNEMEYHLPFEEGAGTLRKIITLLERNFPNVYFPIEVRVVAADDVWLSPFYKRPTCSIAIHHDSREDPQPYFKAAEAIFRAAGGRPHWGKMHNLTAAELSKIYPRWADAMAVRKEMDPENRFVSPYIAQLLGISL